MNENEANENQPTATLTWRRTEFYFEQSTSGGGERWVIQWLPARLNQPDRIRVVCNTHEVGYLSPLDEDSEAMPVDRDCAADIIRCVRNGESMQWLEFFGLPSSLRAA